MGPLMPILSAWFVRRTLGSGPLPILPFYFPAPSDSEMDGHCVLCARVCLPVFRKWFFKFFLLPNQAESVLAIIIGVHIAG